MIRQKVRERLAVSDRLPMEGAAFYFKEYDRKFEIYDKRSLFVFKAEYRIR